MTALNRANYAPASRCARAIRQGRADQFIDEAQRHADEIGAEVEVTRYGVEFVDADGEYIDAWDYDSREEASVRY